MPLVRSGEDTTVKIAHIADVHLSEKQGKATMPLEEQRDVLDWIAGDLIEHDCKMTLVAGDLFDARVSTAAERKVAAGFLVQLPAPILVRGNHDDPLDIAMMGYVGKVFAFTRPGTIEIQGVQIHCLPWPTKAHLAQKADSLEATDEAVKAGLRRILQGFKAKQIEGKTSVLLAHVDTMGARWDGGQEAVGQPVCVTVDDLLSVGADYVALGHYHRRQEVAPGIRYAGATRQMKFGDDPAKGYLIYDTETKEVEERNAPGRRLIDIPVTFKGGMPFLGYSGQIRKTDIVRMQYEVEESDRERARQAVQTNADGLGCRVHIEPKVIASTSTRLPALQKAQTIPEKIRAVWEEEGAPARAEMILQKAEGIR